MAATKLNALAFGRKTPVNLKTALDAVDAGNKNTFDNTGKTLLRVKNASGGALTVSVPYTTNLDSDLTAVKREYTVADAGDTLLGPFPVALFSATPTVEWSTGTNVTAKVLEPGDG